MIIIIFHHHLQHMELALVPVCHALMVASLITAVAAHSASAQRDLEVHYVMTLPPAQQVNSTHSYMYTAYIMQHRIRTYFPPLYRINNGNTLTFSWFETLEIHSKGNESSHFKFETQK